MSPIVLPAPVGGAPRDTYRPRLARVLSVREEIAARGATRPVVTLALERGDLHFRPGQFLQVGVFGAGEVPISISSRVRSSGRTRGAARRWRCSSEP